jgi:hypothetical protein
MAIEIVKVLIYGKSPLLQSNPDGEQNGKAAPKKSAGRAAVTTKKDSTSFQEAQRGLYRTDDGRFYHPAIAFWRGLCETCVGVQIKTISADGKKEETKSANSVLPPAIFVAEEEAILYDPDTLRQKKPRPLGEKDWMVDSRRINNPKVSGNPLVHRAKWRNWATMVFFELDTDVIPLSALEVVTKILTDAGRQGAGCGRTHKPEGKSKWVGIGMGKYRAELP